MAEEINNENIEEDADQELEEEYEQELEVEQEQEALEQEIEEEESEEEEELEENAEDEEESEEEGEIQTPRGPHFDLVDTIFFVMICGVLADIFDLTWVAQFIFTPLTVLWLHIKGVKNIGRTALILAVKVVPVLGEILPAATVASIITVWGTNSPESFNKFFGIAGKVLEAKK